MASTKDDGVAVGGCCGMQVADFGEAKDVGEGSDADVMLKSTHGTLRYPSLSSLLLSSQELSDASVYEP